MKPETTGPWRKQLRREAKGQPTGRRRAREPIAVVGPARRERTWLRRHKWMPDVFEIYRASVRRFR